MAYKFQQGLYKPVNPKKYKGNPANIVYRSSWELTAMRRFDTHPDVVEWASEEFCIPYTDLATGKARRYFPDFWIKLKRGDIEEIWVIEIKPESERRPPIKGKKAQRTYLKEVFTYGKNIGKWSAAERFCQARGWKFKIWSERELGLTR